MAFLVQFFLIRRDKLLTIVYELMFIRKQFRTATIRPLVSFC